ncbi:MAG: hypothetical protein WD600_10025 [Pseudohongiella sp.]
MMSGLILRGFFDSLRGFDWSELRYVSACGYWPLAVYAVVWLACLLLVMLLCSLLLMPKISASWHDVSDRFARLELRRAALQAQFDAGAARNLSMSARYPQRPYPGKHFRPGHPMPAVLDLVGGAATARGIVIAALRPEKLWQQASLEAFQIEAELSADKRQLRAFLMDIEAVAVALAIKQVDWDMTSSRGKLTLFLIVDDKGIVQRSNAFAVTEPAGADEAVSPGDAAGGAGWRRVAYIQRGDRFLEVLRSVQGKVRQREGQVMAVKEAAGKDGMVAEALP